MFLQSPQHPVELESGYASVTGMSAIRCRNGFTLEPFVSGCTRDLDFAILFENLVLSVIPSVCFLFLSSYRIWYLHSRRVLINGGLFLFLGKLVSLCN